MAAVSYDSESVLRAFAGRKGIHYPLLSDQDSKIIRELGILNETVEKTNPNFGIPYPGSFVLDSKGVIVAKYFEDDYRQRYTAADLLMHQFGVIPAQATSDVEGKQLKLTAAASNAVVTVGQRVALTLDIELRPNMHVYAPGVERYIPIDWTMRGIGCLSQEHAGELPQVLKCCIYRPLTRPLPALYGPLSIDSRCDHRGRR